MARPEWDVEAALRGLNIQAQPIKHQQEGEGRRYIIDKPVASELELYPERRVVRYRTPAFEARLGNVETLFSAPNMLALVAMGEAELTTLTVQADPDGRLTIDTVVMSRLTQTLLQPVAEIPVTSEGGGVIPAEAAQPQASAERRKQERTQFQGRLGFAPQLTTNTEGVDLITVSVAFKPQDAPRNAKPEWRNTTFYRERAQRVAEMHLQKGETVDVISYRDVRDVVGKGGKVRQETVYNGVMLRRA